MRITGSGNVGIGTMDPKGKLHAVETNLNNSYIFVASTATDSGSYKVVVSTTGNVGIGTTAPNAKLDVSGSLRATSLTNNITSSAFVMNVGSANGSTGSPAVALWGVSDTYYPGAVHLITQNGNIQFYNYNGSSWSELMRITSGGNVGIGTTSPEEKLEVNGDIKANNFKGKLNGLKIYAGVRTFSSGSCGDSVNSPCQVDISGGGFSGTPVCTITMQNIDSTGYTENMVIKSVSSTALYLWKGQYQNEGTTMIVNWICVGG